MKLPVNLDDIEILNSLDPSGMLKTVSQLPEQLADALKKIPTEIKLHQPQNSFNSIVAIGTGGGFATAAELLRCLCYKNLKLPFVICQDYEIPGFVNQDTLALVGSYSGDTEETVCAYKEAKMRTSNILVFTTDGKLAELSNRDGYPVIKIPKGYMPRAAFGYIVVAMLAALWKLGLLDDKTEELLEAIAVMKRLRRRCLAPEISIKKNIAKQVASALYLKFPIIYGSMPLTCAVGLRLKRQLSENGKTLAAFNTIPGMHHDEIVGWELPKKFTQNFVVILLKDKKDLPKIKRRLHITKELLEGKAAAIFVLQGEGRGELARLLSLVYICDFISVYTSFIYKQDPTAVAMIDLLKSKMAAAD